MHRTGIKSFSTLLRTLVLKVKNRSELLTLTYSSKYGFSMATISVPFVAVLFIFDKMPVLFSASAVIVRVRVHNSAYNHEQIFSLIHRSPRHNR